MVARSSSPPDNRKDAWVLSVAESSRGDCLIARPVGRLVMARNVNERLSRGWPGPRFQRGSWRRRARGDGRTEPGSILAETRQQNSLRPRRVVQPLSAWTHMTDANSAASIAFHADGQALGGAAMDKDYLLLKRAALSRPSGKWKDGDFDVTATAKLSVASSKLTPHP
jgi:hypothetical protein